MVLSFKSSLIFFKCSMIRGGAYLILMVQLTGSASPSAALFLRGVQAEARLGDQVLGALIAWLVMVRFLVYVFNIVLFNVVIGGQPTWFSKVWLMSALFYRSSLLPCGTVYMVG